jgi:phosphopentomutase
MFRRIILIVLDSVGIGEMPDAAHYGDAGSDTLGNIQRQRPMKLPNLCALGLGNIRPFAGLDQTPSPRGSYGKCALLSDGKDTTTGHWEMAGIILDKGFPTYPHGFPRKLIEEFERRIGRMVLGNIPASGTEIIRQLGEEHMRTGRPIVYTSADSVFQIAAHEDVISVPELYRVCEIARELLDGPNRVGRVIARPFTGASAAEFRRTPRRHDYAIPPPPGMLLDRLSEAKTRVYAIGKISDVFLGRGVTDTVSTESNRDGMQKTLEGLHELTDGFMWVNLVDFDMVYGHRNDIEGYASALEEFDRWLPALISQLTGDDLLLLTADHGCDPTTPGTDHSREFTPLLACGPAVASVPLGTRSSLADIGATIAENFGGTLARGESFLGRLRTASRQTVLA